MFITRFDLETTINVDDVDILAENNSDHLTAQEKAISTVKSYIQHRYDPDEVFIEVNEFNPQTAYVVDDLIYYKRKYYVCIQAGTGNLPTVTAYFTESDSRDPSIVDIVCILTVYFLFRKVSPRVIPDLITDEYDRVIDDLKAYQKGTRTILLTVHLDDDDEEEGHRITYDSETQKDWNF